MTEKFIVGIAGSPFGIKGFVKVRPCSGEIEHLLKLQSVTVDGKELKVEETAPSPPFALMRFEGFDNPEKAKTLGGARLLAGRENAASLGKDEFYIEDLKGLPVLSESGEVLGHITDVIEGGGGHLAEIKLSGSDKKLVPFRREFFLEIDPQKGRLVLQNLWILE